MSWRLVQCLPSPECNYYVTVANKWSLRHTLRSSLGPPLRILALPKLIRGGDKDGKRVCLPASFDFHPDHTCGDLLRGTRLSSRVYKSTSLEDLNQLDKVPGVLPSTRGGRVDDQLERTNLPILVVFIE